MKRKKEIVPCICGSLDHQNHPTETPEAQTRTTAHTNTQKALTCDPGKNWWEDESRAPKLNADDTLLFSEHGRSLDNVDYRSHYFRLVRAYGGNICLLVEHGGGYERIDEYALRKVVSALQALTSDQRYLTLYALYQMYKVGATKARNQTADIYRTAFVQGRLKKRKMRGVNAYRVTIEHNSNGGKIT